MRLARLTNAVATLRRPVIMSLSFAVVATGFLPLDAAQRAAYVQRVVATPTPIKAFKPLKVEIPRIDLEANVVPVGTTPDGQMDAPKSADDVGWWDGRKAGDGNLLLDGHHDWNGRVGSFYRLPELKEGDEIRVQGDEKDKVLVYRIVWIKNFDRNIDATDLLGNENGQVATLITCGGTWDSIARTRRERVVARAELVRT
jgi:LPXTG-site transpeptidase (sortase) family protein